MVSAGVSLLSIVQSFVPDAAPTRPYINTKCLQLIDQRTDAFNHNLQYEYTRLDREIGKVARQARRDFIRTQILEQDWVGVKLCRKFVAKPISIYDEAGFLQPI